MPTSLRSQRSKSKAAAPENAVRRRASPALRELRPGESFRGDWLQCPSSSSLRINARDTVSTLNKAQ